MDSTTHAVQCRCPACGITKPDRLREKVAAAKHNRWAGFSDEELEDLYQGLLHIDPNHPNAAQVQDELVRREGKRDG